MRGGVEPQTLCVLQTPTRNPLMYETRILVGTEGVEPCAPKGPGLQSGESPWIPYCPVPIKSFIVGYAGAKDERLQHLISMKFRHRMNRFRSSLC